MKPITMRLAALAAAAVLALSACGGGGDDPAAEPAGDPVTDLMTETVKGPVGAVSRANDVAGQLEDRLQDLDNLP